MLIGPAGTGKGVVIDAAARAEQHAGRETIGVAVSGSTAERLGSDSPALAGQTMTVDALIARASTDHPNRPRHHGLSSTRPEWSTTNASTLDELVERSGAKLVAVGDGRQLPSIGAGGMFDRLAKHAPTASSRTSTAPKTPPSSARGQHYAPGEPSARWRTTPHTAGCTSPTPATKPASTPSHWAELTERTQIREVALIADASNTEIDRLNARAQHLRAQRGELGDHESHCPASTTAYAKATTSRSSHNTTRPGRRRVENGSRGQVPPSHDARR